MLIYVEGKNFLGQTFVLSCNKKDTVGRVKSLVLHILYGMGHGDHSFRLKYSGHYLREPLTLQDYNIPEMGILQMVPISFGRCARAQTTAGLPRPFTTSANRAGFAETENTSTHSQLTAGHDTLTAIKKEIDIFHRRQSMLGIMRAVIWLQLALTVVNFATIYWWSGFWTGLAALLSLYFLPTYVHVGGAMGKMNLWDSRLMIIYGICYAVLCLPDVVMFVYLLVAIVIQSNCSPYPNPNAALGCAHRVWLSLVLYPLHALLLVSGSIVAVTLLGNFKFEAGKLIEPTLTKVKEVKQLIQIAQGGRTKDKRQVAFELNNVALLGDANKILIASEGGVQLLTTMASGEDEVTQEYAIEALAELLSLPSIQYDFISQGGVATLCALLRSFNSYIVQEAAAALSYLTPHCHENRTAVVHENGLDDLLQAYQRDNQRSAAIHMSIGKVLLDLSRCGETQRDLCANTELVDAIVARAGSEGTSVECKTYALQTLEELGKIEPEMVLQRVKLIPVLLDALNSMTFETEVEITIMTLILIFAKHPQGSRQLVSCTNLLSTLIDVAPLFAHSKDLSVLLVDVVQSLMLQSELRVKLVYLGVRKLLSEIQTSCSHRGDLVGTVEQCLQLLES